MAQQRRQQGPQQGGQQRSTGEVEEPGSPIPNVPPSQVAHPNDPEPMGQEENELTTTALLAPREIEVDSISEVQEPRQAQQSDYVVIRMNTTLEDFTYGTPQPHYRLEEGKRYRMPRHIAEYLDGLGYVWH